MIRYSKYLRNYKILYTINQSDNPRSEPDVVFENYYFNTAGRGVGVKAFFKNIAK